MSPTTLPFNVVEPQPPHEDKPDGAEVARMTVADPPAQQPVKIGKFTIRKAERKQAPVRINLTGLSGSGKTMNALFIAFGLTDPALPPDERWSKILLIDSENGSGELYVNTIIDLQNAKGITEAFHIGEYAYLRIDPPFTPELYIEAMAAAEQFGAEIVIVDSASHEWSGQGGCLEIVDQIKRTAKNKWTDPWGQVTPRHTKFIEKVLRCKSHVIITTRRKGDYVEQERDGRKKIEKVGTKEIQREGFEYEFTTVLDFDRETHFAIAEKDRTGLFSTSAPFRVTPDTGVKIRDWNLSGAARIGGEGAGIDKGGQQGGEGGGEATARQDALKEVYAAFRAVFTKEQVNGMAERLDALTGGYRSFQSLPDEELFRLRDRIRSGETKVGA